MIDPWIAVAVMFAVTYALRAVPLLLVRGVDGALNGRRVLRDAIALRAKGADSKCPGCHFPFSRSDSSGHTGGGSPIL